MTLGDFLDKPTQSMEDISNCLAGTGFRIEDDKIDRKPFMQGDSDFRVAFEPADTWAMTGTRIHNDDRGLGGVEAILNAVVGNAGDAKQRVVCRLFEPASIENELMVEVKKRGLARTVVGQ